MNRTNINLNILQSNNEKINNYHLIIAKKYLDMNSSMN